MKKTITFLLSLLYFFSVFCQDIKKQYEGLKKKARKPNIIHASMDFGLGVNFLNDVYVRETKTTVLTNPSQTVKSESTYFDNKLLPMVIGRGHLDFIETKKLYFGGSAILFYSYAPYKAKTPSSFLPGDEITKKSKTHSTGFDIIAKIGMGSEAIKILFGLGIGNLSVVSHGNGTFSTTLNNREINETFVDTVDHNRGYQRAIIGIRLGSNRKRVFEISFYKFHLGKKFFAKSDQPFILKSFYSFSKLNEIYPMLPYGVSASFARINKYKISLDYRLFRDYDFISKNSSMLLIAVSKHFDFHNHKKK